MEHADLSVATKTQKNTHPTNSHAALSKSSAAAEGFRGAKKLCGTMCPQKPPDIAKPPLWGGWKGFKS